MPVACQLSESGGLLVDAQSDTSMADVVVVDAANEADAEASTAEAGMDVAVDAPVLDVPATITGLQAWYRSDLHVTQDGSVSGWDDLSGIGDLSRNLSQSTITLQPTFTSSDTNFNNHPSLSTTYGVEAWLATGFWSSPLTQPFTVFAVARATNAAAAWLFDNSTGTANSEVTITTHGGGGKLRAFAGAYGADVNASINNTYCLIAVFDSASSGTKLYVSQNTPQAGANLGLNAPSPLLVGDAVNDGAGNFAGWTIAEMAFYSGVLSASNIATLNTYASVRYSLVIGP